MLFSGSLLCAGCGKSDNLSYDSSPENIVVKYRSGGGLAPLSADQMPQFTLYGNGRVIRDSRESKTGMMLEGKLAPAEVTTLLEKLEAVGYFKLKNKYFNRDIMDGASSSVTVNLEDETKTVNVYAMDVKDYASSINVLMEFPIPGEKEYVPEKGYLFVQSVDPTSVKKDNYLQLSALLPTPEELQKATKNREPIEIDGDRLAQLKRFESDTGKYGIEIVVNGSAYRVFPIYEPSRR